MLMVRQLIKVFSVFCIQDGQLACAVQAGLVKSERRFDARSSEWEGWMLHGERGGACR